MVQVYESEQEQIEALKAWWSENAVSVIAGVVIGVGGLVGWNYWQAKVQAHQEAASSQYMMILEGLEQSATAEVPQVADGLVADYADTHYASLSQLAAARVAVEASDLATAKTRLQWVIDQASTKNFERVARLRLASVELSQGDLDAAKAALDVDFPENFGARVNELLGDIAVAEGDKLTARLSYEKALNAKPASTNMQLLQMKRDSLGQAELTDS